MPLGRDSVKPNTQGGVAGAKCLGGGSGNGEVGGRFGGQRNCSGPFTQTVRQRSWLPLFWYRRLLSISTPRPIGIHGRLLIAPAVTE